MSEPANKKKSSETKEKKQRIRKSHIKMTLDQAAMLVCGGKVSMDRISRLCLTTTFYNWTHRFQNCCGVVEVFFDPFLSRKNGMNEIAAMAVALGSRQLYGWARYSQVIVTAIEYQIRLAEKKFGKLEYFGFRPISKFLNSKTNHLVTMFLIDADAIQNPPTTEIKKREVVVLKGEIKNGDRKRTTPSHRESEVKAKPRTTKKRISKGNLKDRTRRTTAVHQVG